MAILINKDTLTFHLCNDQISYVMQVKDHQFLIHVYYGPRIKHFTQVLPHPDVDRASLTPQPAGYEGTPFSLDTALQEFPGNDHGDYRQSAFDVTYADGTKATALAYKRYQVMAGKPKLPGLPATYVNDPGEADTLTIVLGDDFRHLEVWLQYTIFRDLPVITRSVSYHNLGKQALYLEQAGSFALDLPDARYELLQLPGAWAREKQIVRSPLPAGRHVLESRRGASSAHQQPFLALVRPETTERSGEVFAIHLVYSGNFELNAQVDPYDQTRLTGGIGSSDFRWRLASGASFQAPEVVMVYSNAGLNGMSQAFHRLYRKHLTRGRFRDQVRPVVINNWETTYFNFDAARILSLAKKAKAVGAELFVLDDGWFGHRNDDRSSLGDWQPDLKKLPEGLAKLAHDIHHLGLKFGLWFEPEMVSPDSQLYRQHPDWVLGVPKYPLSTGRHQLVLDFSRKDVRTAIAKQISNVLDTVPIDFIKWDMNRNITEVASAKLPPERQMETLHRYILGLYDLADQLTTKYPNTLFENCSAGGGRFDPGMSYYMPQSWTSDNTDAIERMKIQYGTSLIFPPIMMDAHLSEVPNDQVGRVTPLATRLAVAESGNFGLMQDLTKKDAKTLAALKQAVADYKAHRELIQFGTFYRLLDPFTQQDGAWMFVDKAQTHARVVYVQSLNQASKPLRNIKLVGLAPDATYSDGVRQWQGDELMNYGLYLNQQLNHDFESIVLDLTKV